MQDADTPVDLSAIDDGLAEAMASRPEPEPSPGDADQGAETVADDGSAPTRDEKGRFAKAQAEAEEATAEASQDRDTGNIPAWRLRELREERDRIAAERETERRELEALRRERIQWQRQQQEVEEPPPPRPDPISDPEGYQAWMEQRFEEGAAALQTEATNRWVNLTFAEQREKDPETFDKAVKALQDSNDFRVAGEIRESVNPARALMRWYRDLSARQEIGGDLDGYKKRLQDEWLKDPEVRKRIVAEMEAEARGSAPAGRSSQNVTPLPSVNRASGRADRQTPGALGNTDAEKFASLSAMDGRRR